MNSNEGKLVCVASCDEGWVLCTFEAPKNSCEVAVNRKVLIDMEIRVKLFFGSVKVRINKKVTMGRYEERCITIMRVELVLQTSICLSLKEMQKGSLSKGAGY